MKGRLVEEVESRLGRRVSFEVGPEEKEGKEEALEDPWKELEQKQAPKLQYGRVVVVDTVFKEPMEEYDIAFKEDTAKMKEMGLPLGFLNVSPFEVEEGGGVVETAVKDRLTKGKRRGKKKRKRVIDEETRAKFDSEWWPDHGQGRVMEVWRERYGGFMEGEEQEQQEGEEQEQTWKEYEEDCKQEERGDDGEVAESSTGGWGASTQPAESQGWGQPSIKAGKEGQGWGQPSTQLAEESQPRAEPEQGWGQVGKEGQGWGQPSTETEKEGQSWGQPSTQLVQENKPPADPEQGWGQAPPSSAAASGWGESVTFPAKDIREKERKTEQEQQGWGEAGGQGWGDQWGGEGGGQADWDALWVEVSNEVYQAELVKWVARQEEGDGRETEEIGQMLQQVELEEKVEASAVIEDVIKSVAVDSATAEIPVKPEDVELPDDLDEPDEFVEKTTEVKEKDPAWRQQKAKSGLGSLLKQLQGQEGEVVAVPEMIGDEGPEERGVEREMPGGLQSAVRAFDQLGFVWEEGGSRSERTPGVR